MAIVSRISKPSLPCSSPAIFNVASGILLALRRLLTWAVLCQISCHAFSLFPYSLSRILALLYLMSLRFLSPPHSFREYSSTFTPPTFFTYRLPVSISFLIPFILFPFLLLSPFRFLSIHFFPINSWPLKAIWESTDATLCNKGLHTCEAILSSCLKSIFILSVSHSLALVVNLPVSQQLSLSANGSTNQLDCGAT